MNCRKLNVAKVKIGIAHPRMGRGGSEARAMWASEALKEHFSLTLITSGGVDLDELNEFYGTSVERDQLLVRNVPIPAFPLHKSGGDALRGAFFQRYCRRITSEFDVLISTYNLCDFGVPAIHFVADFCWDEETRRSADPVPVGLRGLFHRSNLVRRSYFQIVKLVSPPSGRNLFCAPDCIVANSLWSAKLLKEKHGVEVDVLYPPVIEASHRIPLERREFGFVWVGRISPEKRIERVIEILEHVRQRGHDIHLHLVGQTDSRRYGRFVRTLCNSERHWISLEGERFGEEKWSLISKHLFGINARSAEPFGISVAEMVKCGCIVWVPGDGGQVEIVNHSLLTYSCAKDAVDKIDMVLRSRSLQENLRQHLAKQGSKFSTESFVRGTRKTVESFVKNKNMK